MYLVRLESMNCSKTFSFLENMKKYHARNSTDCVCRKSIPNATCPWAESREDMPVQLIICFANQMMPNMTDLPHRAAHRGSQSIMLNFETDQPRPLMNMSQQILIGDVKNFCALCSLVENKPPWRHCWWAFGHWWTPWHILVKEVQSSLFDALGYAISNHLPHKGIVFPIKLFHQG